MQVRLAHEQGLLSRPSLNPIQQWALQYWVYLDRRTGLDDKQTELEHQCFNLFPERWGQLYRDQMLPALPTGDLGTAFGGEPELPVTDPNDLNAWYENIESSRGMTGAGISAYETSILGYAEGSGRRV